MDVNCSKKIIEHNLADAKIMLIEQLDVNLSIDKLYYPMYACISMGLSNNHVEHVILLREHVDSYILFRYSFIVYSLIAHDNCNIFNHRLKFYSTCTLNPLMIILLVLLHVGLWGGFKIFAFSSDV